MNHTRHPRWVAGLVGAVEYVDLDCPACTVRELRAEAAEISRRLAPGALDWLPTLERARERAAVRARLREIAAELSCFITDETQRIAR